jgi:hypothetical protein
MEIFLAPRYATLFIYTLTGSHAVLSVEHGPLPGTSSAKRVLDWHDRERQGRGTSGSVHAGKCAGPSGTLRAEGYLGMTDMTDKSLFIEENIINSVKKLISGRVNELIHVVQRSARRYFFMNY